MGEIAGLLGIGAAGAILLFLGESIRRNAPATDRLALYYFGSRLRAKGLIYTMTVTGSLLLLTAVIDLIKLAFASN